MENQETKYEGEVSFAEALAGVTQQEGFDQTVPEGAREAVEEAIEKDSQVEGEAGEVAAQEAAATETSVAEPAEAPEAPAPEPPPVDRSLARLMAREEAIEREKAAIAAERAELQELRAKVSSSQGDVEMFKIDPVGYLREFAPDIDLRQLAEDIWYESKGEEAPDSYRATKEARAARAEARRLRAQLEESKRTQETDTQQDANSVMQSYVSDLSRHAQTVDAAEYPLLARMAAKDGNRAAATMFAQAQRIAQETYGQRVLTPAEAAAEAEKTLRAEIDWLTGGAASSQEPPKQEAQAESGGIETLRNSSTTTQPDREAEDPYSDEALRRKAFAAIGLEIE